MILRAQNPTGVHESRRPSAAGSPFRSRYLGDDATTRISRLTEALRRYGHDIPRTFLAGPEEVCWIG